MPNDARQKKFGSPGMWACLYMSGFHNPLAHNYLNMFVYGVLTKALILILLCNCFQVKLLLMDDEGGELQYTNEPEFTEEVQQPITTTSKNKEVGSLNFRQMKA